MEEACIAASDMLMSLISKNAHSVMSQEEYGTEEAAYMQEYEDAKSRLERAETEFAEQKAKRQQILNFILQLQKQNTILIEFDETLFASTVDTITVFSDRHLVFHFKDGNDIPYSIA